MSPSIPMLIGCAMIVIGIVMVSKAKKLKQACTTQTTGTVIRIDKQIRTETYTDEDDGNTTKTKDVEYYTPVYEYAAGEQSITKAMKSASTTPRLQVGKQISVFYNPHNPQECYVAEERFANNLGILVIVLGALILAVGIIMYVNY